MYVIALLGAMTFSVPAAGSATSAFDKSALRPFETKMEPLKLLGQRLSRRVSPAVTLHRSMPWTPNPESLHRDDEDGAVILRDGKDGVRELRCRGHWFWTDGQATPRTERPER
jgi:hypothetical protein